MIFISGIHGVGKTYFCNMVKDQLNIKSYSASQLISEKKHSGFSKDKFIPDIDENQQYLLAAISDLRKSETNFILDGHFCLLNGEGIVTRIPLETFTALKPDAIILLTEDPAIISERRKSRDNIDEPTGEIENFQNEEKKYAEEVSKLIGAKLFVSSGAADLPLAINFLKTM